MICHLSVNSDKLGFCEGLLNCIKDHILVGQVIGKTVIDYQIYKFHSQSPKNNAT